MVVASGADADSTAHLCHQFLVLDMLGVAATVYGHPLPSFCKPTDSSQRHRPVQSPAVPTAASQSVNRAKGDNDWELNVVRKWAAATLLTRLTLWASHGG